LIVEIDGETHLGREDEDRQRTAYLHGNGWRVLRFWNTEVFDERESVLEAIYHVCVERKKREPAPSPPTPLPRSTGGEGSKRGDGPR
jgi:very-short-patch-repair endonuclease